MARKVKVVQNVVRVVKHKQIGAQGPEGSLEGLQPKIAFDLTGAAVNQGELAWNADEDTLDLGQHERVLQLGQELGYFARNGNAGLISNGRPVMVTGTIGNSGRMVFDLMDGTNPANAKYFLGLVTEDFDSGEDGHVTSFGKVRGIDTTGALSFGGLETWNDGDVLYVDPVNVGYLTNVAPTSPAMSLAIAFVVHAHISGTLYVRATSLDENALGGSERTLSVVSTTTYTPTADDKNSIIFFTNAAGCTVTLEQLPSNTYFSCVQSILAGPITFVAGTFVGINSSTGTLVSRGANSLIDVNYFTATQTYISGDLTDPTNADEVVVDAAGFSGNLSATDTDVQTALATLDAMSAGGGISAGATLPASPTAQDLFVHTPTGRTWLMRYDGVAWIPEIQLDDSDASIYVDATLGTDSQNNGFGSGADAFATLNFALSNLPLVGNGQRIIVNVAEDDYTAEGFILLDRETLDVAIYGVPSTVATETITGKGLGTITVAGAGWTTDEHAGRWANIVATNWYIISNTSDTLTVQQNVDISTATSPAWTTLNIQDYPLLGGTGGIITQTKKIDIQGFNVTSSYSNFVTQFIAQQECIVKRIASVASNNSGRAMSIFADSMAVESCHLEHTSSINDNYLFNSERGECTLYQVNAIKAKVGASIGNFLIRDGHGIFTRTRSDGGGYVASEGGSIQFNNFPCDVIDAAAGVHIQSTGLGYSIGSGLLTFTNCTTDILDDRPQGGSSSGTSFPSDPVKGHTFLLSLTGREVQFVYDGTDWVPTLSIGAMTMYVDGASGTDSVTSGTGTGTSAFATIQYAIDQVPANYAGDVNIYIAAGSYDENVQVRGKNPTGEFTLTLHGALTDLETAASATCTLGTGGNHGTVTKTAQFTGDSYAKKLAYFVTDDEYRVIYTHTNDTLNLVGQIPSATTQDVVVKDWATTMTATTGKPLVAYCPLTVKGIEFTGADRPSVFDGTPLTVEYCRSEEGFGASNLSVLTVRYSMVDTTRAYAIDALTLSAMYFYYSYLASTVAGARYISNSSGGMRGSRIDGASANTAINVWEGSNISMWSTDAAFGDTILSNWSTGFSVTGGSGVNNGASFVQYSSVTTPTNADAATFSYYS